MRKLVLIAAAAGCVMALPALALADSVTVGPNGVTVRDRDYHHHHHRHYCRTITERHRGPQGVFGGKVRRCEGSPPTGAKMPPLRTHFFLGLIARQRSRNQLASHELQRNERSTEAARQHHVDYTLIR
jgi:hypothetical protein